MADETDYRPTGVTTQAMTNDPVFCQEATIKSLKAELAVAEKERDYLSSCMPGSLGAIRLRDFRTALAQQEQTDGS